MKNFVSLFIIFLLIDTHPVKDRNDFKIIDKRVGFIEIGAELTNVKEKLIKEGYIYEQDEAYGHLFHKSGEGFAISTYQPQKENIIRGIWVHDKRYKIQFNIGIGTDLSTIKKIKGVGRPEVSDGEGLLMINLDNKVFEIDERLTLTLFLSDGRKHNDYNDSIYCHTGKPSISGKEKVIEILLNDPVGEYERFNN